MILKNGRYSKVIALALFLSGVGTSYGQDTDSIVKTDSLDCQSVFDTVADGALEAAIEFDSATNDDLSAERRNCASLAWDNAVYSLNDFQALQSDESLDADESISGQLIHLKDAIIFLEKSLILDPSSLNTRNLLSQVYGIQNGLLQQIEDFEQVVDVLEKLVLLFPGEHSLLSQIGNLNFRLEKWDEAVNGFERAEALLLSLQPDSLRTSERDSVLFMYVNSQALTHVKKKDAAAAGVAFERARNLINDATDLNRIDSWIAWIEWDGGNIAARILLDSLEVLEAQDDLEFAASGYLNLLAMLDTEPSKNEIVHRLALLEWDTDNQDVAVERLHSLVHPKLSAGSPALEVDSALYQYLEDYGAQCFALGLEHQQGKRNRGRALKYFLQATSVPWTGQARSYLQVAAMLRNNIEAATEYAELGMESSPPENVSVELSRMLMDLHRRAGRMEEAQRYAGMLN